MNERSGRSDFFDSVERIIEDYDLEHGNGEVFVQDGQLYVTVEAPNHATIGVNTPLLSSDEGTIAALKREMAEAMGEFDGVEKFTEYWSYDFGHHNGFTARGFLDMLLKDERFFHETAARLSGGGDPESGELCSIRWVEDDLRSWLADHDYPVTDANLQAMRDMVDPKTLREAGIQAGWWAIEAMIDERRLATADNGRDADALSCDPADPVNLSMTGADTSSMGVAL